MIPAYNEMYLVDAMKCLGEAIDFASNSCNIDSDEFFDLFINSGIRDRFSCGDSKIISGKSGTELVFEIFEISGLDLDAPNPQIEYDFSKEYWCGWILAYYQWYMNVNFKEIHNHISIKEIKKLYSTLHEASEQKFVETVNAIIKNNSSSSKLQTQRKICNISQSELSQKSGISLRTIQQYEIKAKDINKAATMTLIKLSRVLGCKIEDLLEYEFTNK